MHRFHCGQWGKQFFAKKVTLRALMLIKFVSLIDPEFYDTWVSPNSKKQFS